MIIEAWVQKLLGELQVIEPLAHVAGGYLRDRDNDRPVKDVDIFMPAQSQWALATLIERVITKTHPSRGKYTIGGAEYGISDPNVQEVIEYLTDDGWPAVNLINLKQGIDVHANLQRIDFGICRIGYDGRDIIRTPEYNYDREEEQFTLRKCESSEQFGLSLRRYERLQEKYPGWSLSIPGEFVQYGSTLYAWEM